MFLNDILETLDNWFDTESTLENENIDSEDLTGHKSTNDVGDDPPSRTQDEYQASLENFSCNEVDDNGEWLAADTNWNPAEFDGWGNPFADADCWQQQQSSTSCAVVAQIGVYESITGTEISEAEACQIAGANGWYDPETGTIPENVGKFLEYCGISTEQRYDATLVDIGDALERGDKVIVGLDAHEIWYPARDPVLGSPVEQSNAGHAVWITGIDQQPDGSVKIILNDSGTPDGQMKVVDAEDFLNAWEDFGNFLVVADAPEQLV